MVEKTDPASYDDGQLVEVWGDTVDERQVKIAVALGIVLSVPTFLIAKELFSHAMDNQDLARTYAMLVGLFSCLVAGGISARAFPPKRIVTERAIDPEDQLATIMELAAQPQGIGELSSLTEPEREEMKRLGLYDLFAEAERRLATRADQGPASVPPTDAFPGSLTTTGGQQ